MYVSRDGGQSWQISGQGVTNALDIFSVLQDSHDPRRLWAGTTRGVHVSQDGGQRWQSSQQGLPSQFTDVYTLLQARENPQVLWAGTDKGVYVSQDSGQSWQEGSQNREGRTTIFSMLQDWQNLQMLWAGTANGVYVSLDGGQHWQVSSTGLPENAEVTILLQDWQETQQLWAGTNTGLYVSQDSGKSWRDGGTSAQPIAAVFALLQNRQDALELWMGTAQGVYVSRDRGQSWQASSAGLPVGTKVLSLLQDRQDTRRLWAGSDKGLYVSHDGGQHWQTTAQGLLSAASFSLLQDNQEAQKFWVGALFGGVHLSRDGGQNWQSSSQGLEEKLVFTLLADRHASRVLWAGTDAGVYRSRDGGQSWQSSSQGLSPRDTILSILQARHDPRILWAGIVGERRDRRGWKGLATFGIEDPVGATLYLSRDGGQSWQPSSQGLGAKNGVFSLLQAYQDPQVLWAGTREGVYSSRDGGQSWQSSSQGLSEAGEVYSLLQVRQEPRVLWAGTEKGVYNSRDGGQSWVQKKQGLPADTDAWSIKQAVDSHQGLYIIALNRSGGVFWSADSGETWQIATDQEGQLFDSASVSSLSVDATNPQILYAVVPGRGIYVGIDKATRGSGLIVYGAFLGIPVVGFLLYISARYYSTWPARLEQQRQERYPVWAEQIRASLYATNKARLKSFPRRHRDFIREQFRQEYEVLNLVFHPDTATLEVSEHARLEAFQAAWRNAAQVVETNAIEPFRTATNALTELFCEALAFKPLVESATLGQLYGRLIDAANPAFQLNVRAEFPVIYVGKTTFSADDVSDAFGLLNRLQIASDYFALLVVFKHHQTLQTQVRESAYTNDFIVLHDEQFWEILAAKSPVQRLTDYILEQIDLVAVSPYTVGGPVPNKMFFGRAEEEKTLLQNIIRNDYALLANRKVGKTSLLNRVAPRLHRLPHYQVFYCDLQDVFDYQDFYAKLAGTYAEFRAEIDKLPTLSAVDFATVLGNLKRHNGQRQIIMIFDEVDELLAYDLQYKERLFRIFRSLSQRDNIRFIFTGTTTLVARVRHPDSPFFNFCEVMHIGLLDTKAAYDLVTVPMRTLRVRFEDETAIVQRILGLTACHPNMIQYTCDRLIKRINEKQQRTITLADVDMVIASQEFYEHFEQLLWGQVTVLEKFIVYVMWSYPRFTKADVLAEFTQRGLLTEGVEGSLETLCIYSILSRKNGYYTFTFGEFAKRMEAYSDMVALMERYQEEILQHGGFSGRRRATP